MSYYEGYQDVKTYVRNHRTISLNEFLSENTEKLPLLNSKLTVDNARELADIWRNRINQEVRNSKRSLELLTLPKQVHNDWQLAFELSVAYKETAHSLEINALRVLSSAANKAANNLTSFSQAERGKRKFDNLSNTEEITPALLSNTVLQFAHDIFGGNKSATIPDNYMVLLKELATTSLKFRLLLHAVHLLNQKEISDQESHTIKLCLSRIVNLLNKDSIDCYKDILGESVLSQIINSSKERVNLGNNLSNTTKALLNKLKSLNDPYEIWLLVHREKGLYLLHHNGQTDQVIVILEYLLNSFDIWKKNSTPSELTCYRRFIPILEHILADTDIIVKDGETSSMCSTKHTQWNEELFQRKSVNTSSYDFERSINFVLEDTDGNELNTSEFKKKNASNSAIISHQIKNLQDNAAIMTKSKKLAKDYSIVIDGIDFIGDTGYIYEIIDYKDIIVALPVSELCTPHDLSQLKYFETTLNALYYLKANLIKLSKKIKTGKSKDVSDAVCKQDNDNVDINETNVPYGTSKTKKTKHNEEE